MTDGNMLGNHDDVDHDDHNDNHDHHNDNHDDHNENHDENSSQKLGRVCFNKSLYSASYQNISLLSLRCICLKFEIF